MSKKKILICDDDEGIIDVVSIILDEKGYEVVVFDGGELLDIVSLVAPDLILMDLWMPNLDGKEATRLLKQTLTTREIPVIIVSANKDTETIAKEVGANDFIAKPFDIDMLENIVGKYLGS